MYQPGHYLRKTTALLERTLDRLRVVRSSAAYDVIFIYREAYAIGAPFFERHLARLGLPIVYDFDDAVYLPNSSEANRVIGFLKNPGKIPEILRLSAHVVAGNSYLADYAKRYARNVHMVPTCVDTTVWKPRATERADGPPIIGWIGTPTTTPYLMGLQDVLTDLARSHRFVLRVSGSVRPVEMPGVQIENVEWTLEAEVDLFNTCDIGIYPLPDDDWTRGKCGFKAIQFMASGLPVVAAPVGVNQDIVEHGVTGFLARRRQEWIDALSTLIESESLRRRIGTAGRTVVEERYSLGVTAPKLAQIFESATGSARRLAS